MTKCVLLSPISESSNRGYHHPVDGSQLPFFLPIFSQEARLSVWAAAEAFSIEKSDFFAWNVLARDVLMSRAMDAKLLPVGTVPKGTNIVGFLSWLSSSMSTPWTVLLSDYERDERRHVHKVTAIHRRRFN